MTSDRVTLVRTSMGLHNLIHVTASRGLSCAIIEVI
jgi:hypothetical protein